MVIAKKKKILLLSILQVMVYFVDTYTLNRNALSYTFYHDVIQEEHYILSFSTRAVGEVLTHRKPHVKAHVWLLLCRFLVRYSFSISTGVAQLFQKSKSHLKIPGARKVTRSKSCTVDPLVLGTTVTKFSHVDHLAPRICATLL